MNPAYSIKQPRVDDHVSVVVDDGGDQSDRAEVVGRSPPGETHVAELDRTTYTNRNIGP